MNGIFITWKEKNKIKNLMKNLNQYGHEPYTSNLVSKNLELLSNIEHEFNSQKMSSTFEINPNNQFISPW
jgi:hypothetical protein